MSIESPADLAALKRIGFIVAHTVKCMFEEARVGMSTAELDAVGKRILDEHGARPAPKLCYGFQGSTMISVNEEVAHAIPGDRVLQNGDLVNIDVSAELDGYFADTGSTRPIGVAAPQLYDLCDASREALSQALLQVRAGAKIHAVAKAIKKVAHKRGYSVIENLTGHGVGRHIHEAPHHVPDFKNRLDKRRFKRGMVLTVEPFLSTGPKKAHESSDGWTLLTPKGNYTAQFEHTVVVTDGAPLILTAA